MMAGSGEYRVEELRREAGRGVEDLPFIFEVPWRNDATGEIYAYERIVLYHESDVPADVERGRWSDPLPLGPGFFIRTRVTASG
jgi:hypothetical protein